MRPRAVNFELGDFEKEIMKRMSDIYEIQIAAMRAEINNDPLAAEEYILSALREIKALLDDYPKVKNNKRFARLYSAVYTEYRQFYGIDEAINETVGKVFAVRKKLATTDFNWKLSGYKFPDNLKIHDLKVPLVKNKQVSRHLLFYTQKRPDIMETWLKRTEKYFPMMRRIFKEVGTPVELIHLSMIESGLNPRAESWASAMGLWQFMEATGEAYGLDVNWWVDERRDPVKATRAAARHLKDLYERWNNWHLAIAGYNISPRGLISAIRDGGGQKNYWSAWPYLPSETQGYIPGFIAATMIELNPEKFGFKENYNNVEPYQYETVTVAPLMPLDLLAEAAGISTRKLKKYNPELLRWATPPGSSYKLKLPPGIKNRFLANYKKIPEDARSQHIVMHRVQSGETLGHIANRYGTTVRALFETNEGLSSLIFPGQKIIIPLPGGSSGNTAYASTRQFETNSKENNTAKVYYTVKSGDTIGHIAEWYDVRAAQIRQWNNTSNLINIGDRLVIYVPAEKEEYYEKVNGVVAYSVQSNDTLIEIANAFNVSVSSIKKANDLKGSRIYVGQQLHIDTIN